ncbi:hypothetical protein [Halovenus sp. HT40]|uniref:hypothetical protein n=1 Tax=Halovenus sp. HT40 TaxID=3126691 RepID=UPI00300F1BB7
METSDRTFSAAKLREYVNDDLGENDDLYGHTGIVHPESKTQEMLSFLEGIYDPHQEGLPPDLQDTKAAQTLRRTAASRHVGSEVEDTPAFAVGVTEKDVDVSPAQAFSQIQNSIINNGAPYTAVFFGGMNSGKTSTALLYSELWKDLVGLKYDTRKEPVILSNARSLSIADYCLQNVEEFRRHLFGADGWFESGGEDGTPPVIDPDRPKLWIFDECSTHLDARTNNYEVANHYTPLLKRFAKVNTDAIHIGHSGYDVHKELRRPTIITEFVFKTEVKTAEVYEDMIEDQGNTLKYELTGVPDTSVSYDPDDMAPWSWE